MVRNQKMMMLSGGVVAGAVLLAVVAEAVLRSSVHAPAAPGDYTLPASWKVRGGGEETAVFRANGLGRPDAAVGRDRGSREDGRTGPSQGGAGQ